MLCQCVSPISFAPGSFTQPISPTLDFLPNSLLACAPGTAPSSQPMVCNLTDIQIICRLPSVTVSELHLFLAENFRLSECPPLVDGQKIHC